MQSQQKRVKWSRGETAEALEERTDTGITQASVELMENCIPDIYGNISRRPALKPIPLATGFKSNEIDPTIYRPITQKTGWNNINFLDDKILQVVPFYITEDDIILICVNSTRNTYLRIKNGEIVYEYNGYLNVSSVRTGYYGTDGILHCNKVSYAQQNNYLIVATDENVYKIQFEFGAGNSFTPVVETFNFSGGWYAPNGTETKQITTSVLPGLAISGNFYNYVFTDNSGNTTMYMNTDTGLDGAANLELISEEIPVGSIIQMPNAGCYFRVEGYYNEADNLYFSAVTFDSVVVKTDSSAPSSVGNVCVARDGNSYNKSAKLEYWASGVLQQSITIGRNQTIYVKCSASLTGYSSNTNTKKTTLASHWYAWGFWEDADQTDQSVRMYGALLTPVADENATDTIVSVEYGYESLTPDDFNVSPDTQLFPHPTKLCFEGQRLWAGGWAYSLDERYALIIGSQIARYSDFKNDYNQENEPITIDVLTQFKEKITHLLDYNGLKIFTDSFEYAYDNSSGAVKQSANGSLDYCEPLVFESLCLYADSTGQQIRAMQYEFQANIFNSSCINQVASHDLIWYPTYMAAYEDKVNSTGKYLFVVNTPVDNNSLLAVCNFVPSNQANIWNRWTFPQLKWTHGTPSITETHNMIHSVINIKEHPIFLLKSLVNTKTGDLYGGFNEVSLTPCLLDFEGNLDLEGTITADNEFVITRTQAGTAPYIDVVYQSLQNTEIAIYADGEFQFTTTTDANGKITDDLSGLTNITAGLMINSKIVSHPIDVGGKTKSVKKRIGKAQMSVHDTEAGVITINGKTGYMNPAQDHICFYGVSGMKDEVKYTITNKNGAMFHLESLLMNIEYGTLDS